MSGPRIDLVVKKVGEEWCLFTADGTRKLGCHPTEQEAKDQEAAIKSREEHDMMAAKAFGRELLRLEAEGFINDFGCDRVRGMIMDHGLDTDVCRANAAYMGDEAGRFCELLRKGAQACGFTEIVKAGRSGRAAARFELGEISIEGEVETLENGDVRKWIPLAEAGEQWINGPHTFDITADLVKQAIKNFDASGQAPLPVTIGHVDGSDVPAAAWIEDIEERDGAPWGLVRFLAKTWERIQAGEFKFFSLEFYVNDVDRKGEDVGFRIDGGAILNKPFFPIRIDQKSEHGGASCFRLSRFSGTSRKEDPPMSVDKGTAGAAAAEGKEVKIEAAKIEGGKVTLSETQFATLMKSHRENESLRGELATLRSDKEAADARLSKLERGRTHDRIKNAVNKLQDRGVIVQLGDYAIDIEASAFEWLASAPWGVTSVEGLEKLAKDEEATAHLPRIKLGGEKSSGTDRQPPADLSTEAGRQEAVRRGVARLRREYSKEELAVHLRHRPGGIEGLAKEDLAAEHPEYRNEILKMEIKSA